MSADEVARLHATGGKGGDLPSSSFGIGKGGFDLPAAIFWAFVGVPLAWGVCITLQSAARIFE